MNKFFSKPSVIYGFFALGALLLLALGVAVQWCVFGDLGIYERIAVLVVALIVYIPEMLLAIASEIKRKI